jgi:hypothetical protein
MVSLKHNFYCAGEGASGPRPYRENALMQHGTGQPVGVFGAPSASLGISPANSTSAERLNVHSSLLRFAQGRSDSVRMTQFEDFQECPYARTGTALWFRLWRLKNPTPTIWQ